MEEITPTIYEDFIVTCHTDGCENSEIPIEVKIDISGMLVFCGPCALPIEDIVPFTLLSTADKV